MNLPILTKLRSYLSDLKERVKLTDAFAKPVRMGSHPLKSSEDTLLDIIDYIERWINNKEDIELKPTWKNLFKIMKDISPELGELAYKIKVLFNGKHNMLLLYQSSNVVLVWL